MNYQEIETDKFYYGSTVILLGYKHEKFGYKFTTLSSSYTIDNQILIGIGKDADALKQIRKYNNFSINILSSTNMELINAGAANPGADRFKINSEIKYTVDSELDVPLIDGVLAQFTCEMTEEFTLKSNHSFVNIAADIKKRRFRDDLFEEESLCKEKLRTILCYADDKDKFFKV